MTDAELSALAARALTAAGADAQARVVHERRVRPGELRERLVVELAVARGGRVGVARTTDACDAGLAAAAAGAASACDGDRRGGFPGLPAPAPGRPHDGWDPAVARLEPGALPRDVLEGRASRIAIASATGIAAFERRSRVIGRGGTAATGPAALEAARAAWPAVEQSAARAESCAGPAVEQGPARAESSAGPEAAAGEPHAVLSPAAVAVVLDALGRLAFNGLAVAEGRSPLAGRLGTRVAAAAINLSESPRFAGTLPRSYDAEGVPVAPLPLIQDGVAHRVVHDTRSAALAGAASTGHAVRPGGAPDGPRPRNLVLVGGGIEGEAELIAPVEAGVYVTALRGLQAIASGAVSAVAEGYAIRAGELGPALAPLRFTGSPFDVPAAVEAMTMRQRLAPSGTVCPALRVGALRLSPA
jgi:PmbA protein